MRVSPLADMLPDIRRLPETGGCAWVCASPEALRKQLYRYRTSKATIEAVILTFCKIEVVDNKLTIRYTTPPKRIENHEG